MATVFSIIFSGLVFVFDPARRVFNAIFFDPKISVDSFRTERSALIRNESGRAIFLTQYKVELKDDGICEGGDQTIVRGFDVIEKELQPDQSAKIDLLSLEARRATRVDGSGDVYIFPEIQVGHFDYVNGYRNDELGNYGRIIFYSNEDPDLVSRVADDTVRNALPTGVCEIFYTAEFSKKLWSQKFECRAVAGFVGNAGESVIEYINWMKGKVD